MVSLSWKYFHWKPTLWKKLLWKKCICFETKFSFLPCTVMIQCVWVVCWHLATLPLLNLMESCCDLFFVFAWCCFRNKSLATDRSALVSGEEIGNVTGSKVPATKKQKVCKFKFVLFESWSQMCATCYVVLCEPARIDLVTQKKHTAHEWPHTGKTRVPLALWTHIVQHIVVSGWELLCCVLPEGVRWSVQYLRVGRNCCASQGVGAAVQYLRVWVELCSISGCWSSSAVVLYLKVLQQSLPYSVVHCQGVGAAVVIVETLQWDCLYQVAHPDSQFAAVPVSLKLAKPVHHCSWKGPPIKHKDNINLSTLIDGALCLLCCSIPWWVSLMQQVQSE